MSLLPRLFALLICLGFAAPALAEDERLGAEAFRELSEGYTLHFELDGFPYGSEQFFEGRRSLWRFGNDGCEEGHWFEREGAICFLYEGQPGPACWLVLRRDGSIFARSLNDPDGSGELRMSGRDRKPLICQGPSVGV